MKKTVLCLALCGLLGLAGAANALICTIDDVPAATVLLPYFELDLGGPDGVTTLFSIHMLQHLLLTLVAAPLIVLGAPITLLLRVASYETRRDVILPVLHSRVVRALSFPVVAWLLFTAVLWGSHFSPVFNAALEDPIVHQLEHAAYLGAALLFWWPAVALDPGLWRLPYPARALYVFLQMTANTLLAVVLLNAQTVLLAGYSDVQEGADGVSLTETQRTVFLKIGYALLW